MTKLFLINGVALAGKDSFIKFVDAFNCSKKGVVNISSVDYPKEVATRLGWSGTKDEESRKFLKDLKNLFDGYNDFTVNYILDEISKRGSNNLYFYHVREHDNMNKIKQAVSRLALPIEVKTIYVERDVEVTFDNESDIDATRPYDYDIVIQNTTGKGNLSELASEFTKQYLEVCE